MTVDSVSALLILVAAIIPGYLFVFLVRQINRLAFDFGEAFTKTIASVICSLLLYGALEIVVRLLNMIRWVELPNPNVIEDLRSMFNDNGSFRGVEDKTVFVFFLIGIAWPVICGLIVGHLTTSPKLQTCLSWFGADRGSLSGSAWDYRVFQRDHDFEVEIVLTDQRVIRGKIAAGSSVATSDQGGDLFIEPFGPPEIVRRGPLLGIEQGTWVSCASIVSMKVIELQRIGNDGKQK